MTSTVSSYQKCIDNSERVAWTVNDVLSASFDFKKRFLPETLAQVNDLTGLSSSEKLLLNQIRALTYAHLFGLVEEFIVREVMVLASRCSAEHAVERRARAQKLKRANRISEDEFERQADQSVIEILQFQDEAGVDIVTDGEQRRDGFFSFVAEKLEGVQMMTLAEMLELVENKAAFELILQTLDVPAFSISNATCVGRVSRKKPLAADEVRFVQKHTKKAVKVPLPGPYLMTRAMWVKEASRAAYGSKEELGEDVVKVLREEIHDLVELGVEFIQFDEPVLTELVFTQGQVRTFMCAALAARKDPAEELEFAVHLLNRVVAGFENVRIGLHICRGNWSQDETTLLSGSYQPLKQYLERMNVRQFVLEYATERAGDLLELSAPELGLGVVNPRTETVEGVDDVKRSIERALKLYRPERLFVNPDCGFATFSNRPVNSSEIALRKMKTISAAARAFR